MPSTELLIAFLATTMLFAVMPGPAMLYTAAQTVARGTRSGLMAALGIQVGGYVHVIAAAAGLSALFHAVPVLYAAAKFAGAAYLVFLGLKLFFKRAEREAAATAIPPKDGRRAFFESVSVEALNPKTALFFLAFLPQFVDASASLPIWGQLLILGTIVNLIFSLADVGCVLLAGLILKRLKRSGRVQQVMQKLGGAVLVGLGVNLALHRT
ncbi:Threonine/homoserine/homoserine lactone efflux protein [Rhizobium sp. RU20A]|uniref:LysE family translocator n=1 Tax=Rhizobium sp. RU20A TaxID=1907412 RepID=UPI000954E28E|nr:LysE family translocator [Rhizobium sp. RU20A]SIQ23838.1 Threonine/homoserine/homoserine lactone efflux protein [Rhizobium sp. RU20A]